MYFSNFKKEAIFQIDLTLFPFTPHNTNALQSADLYLFFVHPFIQQIFIELMMSYQSLSWALVM